MRTAVTEILTKRLELRDYEVEGDFPVLGHRIMGLNGTLIQQKDGKTELILLSIEDITHQKELNAILQMKLQEIHHRIKNNLQVISSLLSMQTHYQNNPAVTEALHEAHGRIRSMALLHERLYLSREEGKIVFREYIADIIANIFRLLGVERSRINVKIDVKDVYLDMDTAVPCALIINELVTNSIVHAFRSDESGQLRIEMKPEVTDEGTNNFKFVFSDNGAGLPAEIDPENAKSMGLKIISLLTKQLGGTLTVHRNNGTTFRIEFPG